MREPLSVSSPAPRGLYTDAWQRLRANRLASLSLATIAFLVLVAIFADLIAPYDTSETHFSDGKYLSPTLAHPFGTDALARDIFSRTVVGLRISLAASLIAIFIVTTTGVLVGALAAAGPPMVDRILMRVTDVAYAFPDILLIILLRSVFGTEIFGRDSILGLNSAVLLLFLAISLAGWPNMARLVRGDLLSIRENEYTHAAIALGASKTRIVTRHWLPNATGPIIVQATFLVPYAIFAEASLSFMGVGVSRPTPSLGVLIFDHFGFVGVTWTALLIPTTLLAILFLAFSFLGDGLRDALDPRSRR